MAYFLFGMYTADISGGDVLDAYDYVCTVDQNVFSQAVIANRFGNRKGN